MTVDAATQRKLERLGYKVSMWPNASINGRRLTDGFGGEVTRDNCWQICLDHLRSEAGAKAAFNDVVVAIDTHEGRPGIITLFGAGTKWSCCHEDGAGGVLGADGPTPAQAAVELYLALAEAP